MARVWRESSPKPVSDLKNIGNDDGEIEAQLITQRLKQKETREDKMKKKLKIFMRGKNHLTWGRVVLGETLKFEVP